MIIQKNNSDGSSHRLLSLNKVRKELGIGYSKLRKLISRGDICCIDDGSKEKISQYEFDRFIKNPSVKKSEVENASDIEEEIDKLIKVKN